MPYRNLRDRNGRTWRTLCCTSESEGGPSLQFGPDDAPEGALPLASLATATLQAIRDDDATPAELVALVDEILADRGDANEDSDAGSQAVAASHSRRRGVTPLDIAKRRAGNAAGNRDIAASFGVHRASTPLAIAQRRAKEAEEARRRASA